MTTLTVTQASAVDLNTQEFAQLLLKTESDWFREYLSPGPEARVRYFMSRFDGALAAPDGRVFLCTEGERVLGAIALERMAWDSEHFGIECGRIAACCIARGSDRKRAHAELLEKAKKWAKENGIRLLQWRLWLLFERTEEREYLLDVGFEPVDNMLAFWKPLAGGFPLTDVDQRLAFRPAHRNDLVALVAMTRGAFPHSRFVTEPYLDRVKGDAVYARWIENVLTGQESPKSLGNVKTHVRVCSLGGEIIGYGAYHTDSKLDDLLGRRLGMLDLLIISAPHRGHGVGQYLLVDVLEAMRMDGISDVEATTWTTNVGALVVYQRAGLKVQPGEIITYHMWLN